MIVQTSFIANTIKKQHLFCTNTPEVWKISADYSLKSKALWLIACPVINGVWNLRRNINLLNALEGLQKPDDNFQMKMILSFFKHFCSRRKQACINIPIFWTIDDFCVEQTGPKHGWETDTTHCDGSVGRFLDETAAENSFMVHLRLLGNFRRNPFMDDHSVIRDGKSNEMHQISLSVVRFRDDKQDRCDHWLGFFSSKSKEKLKQCFQHQIWK